MPSRIAILDNVGEARIEDPTSMFSSVRAIQTAKAIREPSESTKSSASWLMGSTTFIALAATTGSFQGSAPDWLGWQAAKFAVRALSGTGVTESRAAVLGRYLQHCVLSGAVSPLISSATWRFWEKLCQRRNGNLVVPDACPVPNGNLLLTWDKGAIHFELEVEEDLNASFFYVDRRDKKTAWELTTSSENLTDARIWKALENFSSGITV